MSPRPTAAFDSWESSTFVLETGQRFQGPMTHGGTAPSHYDLHVWTVKRNPKGLFTQYNPRVSCP